MTRLPTFFTGHKPYHCLECNSRFKTKDELKQHGISHTTGKPWHCHYCSMKFKYQASLKRHEKKGRCKIGGKPSWCPPTQLLRVQKKCSISSKENLTENSNKSCSTNLPGKNSNKQSRATISRIIEEDSSIDNSEKIHQNSMLQSKLNILFSSNHNIHKSLLGLCFWASGSLSLIERF